MSKNESQSAPHLSTPSPVVDTASARRDRKGRVDSLRQSFLKQFTELQQLVADDHDQDARGAAQQSVAEAQLRGQEKVAGQQTQLLEGFTDLLGALQSEREKLELLQVTESSDKTLLADEFRELRSSIEDWRRESRHDSGPVDDKQLARLQAENLELKRRLEELEVENAAADGDSDLQRRFELAVRDVRELKQQNAELEKQLQAARSKSHAAPTAGSGDSNSGLDWEAQKRRMLAELETDGEWEEPNSKDEKLSIEGTIRITDDVVAEKDALIQELQDRLDLLTQDGARESANQELLDRDELITQERERLRRLQEEWEAKLRKAEIEISVERAKMARDRRELEEKMRSLQDELRHEETAASDEDAKGGKTNRRWLARLGLTDQD